MSILDAQDAVVAFLNANSYSQTFTAEKSFNPNFTMKEAETLRVEVVPGDIIQSLQMTRGKSHEDNETVMIGILQRLEEDTETAKTDVIKFVLEVMDSFKGQILN